MLKLGQVCVIDFQDARKGPIQYDLVSLIVRPRFLCRHEPGFEKNLFFAITLQKQNPTCQKIGIVPTSMTFLRSKQSNAVSRPRGKFFEFL